MTNFRAIFFTSICILHFFINTECKIVLPHKLRYLENMLNAEVVAKAAKIRQRMEANPNIPESDKNNWPLILGQYQASDKNNMKPFTYNNLMYNRRMPNFN